MLFLWQRLEQNFVICAVFLLILIVRKGESMILCHLLTHAQTINHLIVLAEILDTG